MPSRTAQGLSEIQLTTFRDEWEFNRELKRQRKRLRATGKALGLDKAAVEQAIYRGEKKGLSEEAIKATLERNAGKQKRREAESTAPSQDTISFEDQIVELETLKATATTPEQLHAIMEAHEEAQKQLRQRQQGSDT